MTFDIDSVPAPNKFDPVHLPRPHRYDFNSAARLFNINEEREDFHRWCGRMVNMGIAHTADEWRIYLDTFRFSESIRQMEQQAKDAADLYNTQDDALW